MNGSRSSARTHSAPASDSAAARSPKDTFITVYGRMPVLEVLQDDGLRVDKLVVADNARGDNLDRILRLASRRGVPIREASAHRVKVLAGNGKHDQGIIADVVAPRMAPLAEFLERPARERAGQGRGILVLDGVNNPSNVGMILRTATAAGVTGVVLPRVGSPSVDPLVIKASAGVAFHAPILRCRTAAEGLEALSDAGYRIYGLSGEAEESLYTERHPDDVAFVLGNETEGISEAASRWIDGWVRIPMSGGVESLNVSSAAAVLCFDLVRRAEEGDSRRARRR
ncbi:TrmH family RNA methyltransferase [Streptomyces fuscigenes]|uniref:TrmH family RNA methyltransferase n=1 Tax=Streptomyces fuscigenes TaxID=1528880 RepID=UPI001F2DD956|nr:RNA methyltransferase [Streptomyces fuscigenes]MCF3962446.1 RNA methyltransferase [Streptomyces fuscigenes]